MDINAHKENHFHICLKDICLLLALCCSPWLLLTLALVLDFFSSKSSNDYFKTTNEDNIHQCYSNMYDTQKKMEKCKTKTECEKYKFILSQYQCEKLADTIREKN